MNKEINKEIEELEKEVRKIQFEFKKKKRYLFIILKSGWFEKIFLFKSIFKK
jgi:hypothetical protein